MTSYFVVLNHVVTIGFVVLELSEEVIAVRSIRFSDVMAEA
jgi:hypothetical protein